MILIAEDNAEVRRMIRKLIEDINPEILECSDGAGAIEAYESNHHDFVLMDINVQPGLMHTSARTMRLGRISCTHSITCGHAPRLLCG